MEEKERYIVLSGRQIKDTTNNSQDFLRIETVCKRLNQYYKRIKELEQGLKTREGRINILEERNKGLLKLISKLYKELFPDGRVVTCEECIDYAISQIKENQQLKQQLAEKERQVKKLNLEAQKYFEDAYCNDFHNQDKISFCIEKLEKVKELMRNIDMPNKPELYNNDMFGAGFDSHYIRVEKLIDNQINELKGKVETILTHQHEDKGEQYANKRTNK